MMPLRPYQQATIAAVERGWTDFRRQLAVLPTGAGKTIIAANIVAGERARHQRCLFLAHREELLTQTIDKFHKAAGVNAQLEKAEHRASLDADVVVGSVQTFTSRGDRWPAGHFGLVIVDEAHHAMAASYQRILERVNGARVLGITATPDRNDKRNLGEYFDAVAHEVGLFDLIRDKYLAPITVRSLPLEINLSKVKSTAGDLDAGDLGHALEPYLDAIARAIADNAGFRRTLAFLPLIETSKKFVAACRAVGINAEHVDGLDPQRAYKLHRFANWEYDLLSNAMLLTEGYDDPGIDCLVVLRPTRSRPLFAQMVGRGTRIDPMKDNLMLLDFLWLHERHKICHPASLIAKDEVEADTITDLAREKTAGGASDDELELAALAGAATAQREERLREKLAEQMKRRGQTITAEQFAMMHNSLEAAEFEPVMKWEAEKVSEKQAKVLRRAHIDIETVRGRGHASKLIGLIFGQQSVTLASAAQRATMRRLGHPDANTATAAEARQFFAGLRGNTREVAA